MGKVVAETETYLLDQSRWKSFGPPDEELYRFVLEKLTDPDQIHLVAIIESLSLIKCMIKV